MADLRNVMFWVHLIFAWFVTSLFLGVFLRLLRIEPGYQEWLAFAVAQFLSAWVAYRYAKASTTPKPSPRGFDVTDKHSST